MRLGYRGGLRGGALWWLRGGLCGGVCGGLRGERKAIELAHTAFMEGPEYHLYQISISPHTTAYRASMERTEKAWKLAAVVERHEYYSSPILYINPSHSVACDDIFASTVLDHTHQLSNPLDFDNGFKVPARAPSPPFHRGTPHATAGCMPVNAFW